MSVTLNFTALTTDGKGISRLPDGKVVFVERVLPQETAVVNLQKSKKNHCEGTLVSIETPHSMRRPAPCPVFEKCGGCQLQIVPEMNQTEFKVQWLHETLRRLGRWPQEQLDIAQQKLDIVRPKVINYRQRIRLHFDGKTLGYFQTKSHQIVTAKHCILPVEKITDILSTLESSLIQHAAQAQLSVEITCTKNQKISMEFFSDTHKNSLKQIRNKVTEEISKKFEIETSDLFQIAHPQIEHFQIHKHSFVQPHVDAHSIYVPIISNEISLYFSRLITQSPHKSPQLSRPIFTWDLYSGSGTFSNLVQNIAAQKSIPCVSIAVEGVGPATKAAALNHKNSHVKVVESDVLEFLNQFEEKQIQESDRPQIVIADPPRTGLGQLPTLQLCNLMSAQNALICYVACDAASLARDGAVIIQQGFRLKSITLIDAFAQTVHYETIAFFERLPARELP